ncbi:YibE/F family protein [Actinophytocola oryzae]|uniref:Putative membrane protein n=1 Tax=Actinophytocola oryzae TaxID=502181 RepID=A0A4R7VHW0_9PSEU|nr:putative membrane protein [Actinophytocola oryzae]
MYDGETERIPRVTDRDEPDEHDEHDEHDVVVGHGHGHGHTPAPPASRRVRTVIGILLVPFALAAVVGVVLLYPFGAKPEVRAGAGTPVDGVVTAASTGACNGDAAAGDAAKCLLVTVRMTDGAAPNQEIRTVVPLEPSTPRFAVNDKVVLAYGGGDPADGTSYQLVDFQRDIPLVLLAGLFALAVLVLGRWQGVKALVALVISFVVLVFFVLPAILAGESPLLVGVVGAGVIMFVVLYLTHGLSARTSTAVLGTMISLTLIGVLGALWAAFGKLTGLDDETATLVGLLDKPIDTRGLLLAGVVIGALGVLDDVTVTQTSAVWELRAANPSLTRRQLYAAGLRIGRDHVASAVNTLVMAYAGAALPLLLYTSISGVGIGNILTSQSIAQEIVRTLVGSIGIVAAVPLTTVLAAAVAAQEKPASEQRGRSRKSADEERRPRDREKVGARDVEGRERTGGRERSGSRERADGRERSGGSERRRADGREAGGRERADSRERASSRGRVSPRERADAREGAEPRVRPAARGRADTPHGVDRAALRDGTDSRDRARERATSRDGRDGTDSRERAGTRAPREGVERRAGLGGGNGARPAADWDPDEDLDDFPLRRARPESESRDSRRLD